MCSSTASRRSRASSGSRPFNSSSDCRRSANRTVTTFRSPPRVLEVGRSASTSRIGGTDGEDPSAGDHRPAESGPLAAPQPPQKPSFTSLRKPHDGQTRLKERPHVPQKRWLVWFRARHRGHSIAGHALQATEVACGEPSADRVYGQGSCSVVQSIQRVGDRRTDTTTTRDPSRANQSRRRDHASIPRPVGQPSELPGCCLRRNSCRSFISLSESTSPLGSCCRSSLAVASYSCSS